VKKLEGTSSGKSKKTKPGAVLRCSKSEELESKAEKQEALIAQQQKQIETLSAGLQKVGDQLEASKAAPQLVVTN
jgi:hypothetical protein